jgi:hypothetical protein
MTRFRFSTHARRDAALSFAQRLKIFRFTAGFGGSGGFPSRRIRQWVYRWVYRWLGTRTNHHNRRCAPLPRESSPKAPGNEASAARSPYSATESAISALLISVSFSSCRRLILVHFRSLPQSYVGFAAGPSRRSRVSSVIVMSGAPQTSARSYRPHVGLARQIPVGNSP